MWNQDVKGRTKARRIAVREAEAAARILGLELHVANAKHQDEIDALFPDLIARGIRAIMIGTDPYFFNQRSQIAALAARYAILATAHMRCDIGFSSYQSTRFSRQDAFA